MLKSAEEVRKIIDDKEYSIDMAAVEEAIEQMIQEKDTYTYSEIKNPKLLEELKALGYTVEPEIDSTYPNMYKISI